MIRLKDARLRIRNALGFSPTYTQGVLHCNTGGVPPSICTVNPSWWGKYEAPKNTLSLLQNHFDNKSQLHLYLASEFLVLNYGYDGKGFHLLSVTQ